MVGSRQGKTVENERKVRGMTAEEWKAENRDALEKRYYEMYEMTLGDSLDGCKEAFHLFEDALVRMGILEPDQVIDLDDDITETCNWDEWQLENRSDALREERMAYEI